MVTVPEGLGGASCATTLALAERRHRSMVPLANAMILLL
jgi:hypothetical protein